MNIMKKCILIVTNLTCSKLLNPQMERCYKLRDATRWQMKRQRYEMIDSVFNKDECYDIFKFEKGFMRDIGRYFPRMQSIKMDYMENEIHISPYE